MKIQAVKFYKNGFMTEPFAFGGEDGMEAFDAGKNIVHACKTMSLIPEAR